ncbi:MAG: hypothetical protein OEU91_01835 [Gammaproteobacteria bacterium]|nr:hypothetical protein [Gammaproteobacteria bacterium]
MYKDINELLDDMRDLQEQMETQFDDARERFRYTFEGGRVRFTREVQDFQRRFRVSSLNYILTARLASVLSAPVIYSMLVPLVTVDLTFTLYQHICFRAYGVTRVRRRDYLVNDRHKLAYLNTIEKVNCAYCGYANGVVAYAREIIARTEQYWCPIRHARRVRGAHARYPRFFDYGDAEAYQTGIEEMRRKLTPKPDRSKPRE